MRKNSLIIAAVAAAALVSHSAQADIALGAPGVPVGSQVATKVPFKNITTISNGYKFVFSGIEAKGNTAGAPGSSGTEGNGGQFHVSATVSMPNKIKTDKIEFRDVQDFNTSPLQRLLFTTDLTYRAVDTPISVTLQWMGEGNAHKPDGIFNILGEYQKQPPVPTGSLNFAVGQWMLLPPGTAQYPDGVVNIVRE
jgi:hypothetical protein